MTTISSYKAVKLSQLLCGLYIIIVTFAENGTLGPFGGSRDSNTGYIVDIESEAGTNEGLILWNGNRRAIVATTNFQMLLLGLSRFSGYFMYPCLILVFATKLRATTAFITRTPFSMYILYKDVHSLHIYCGWVILLDSCLHTTCHLLRWAIQGNQSLLLNHRSGITGFIVIISTLLICIPMITLRKRMKYETRKILHYFFIVFGIAMTYHAPKSAIPNGGFCAYIFPILLVVYFMDALYCKLFMTELIETTIYHTLPSGVQMSMAVSERFREWGSGGYGYICLPWVDRNQWHAFSLFENPSNPNERQVFMQNVGDWTNKVHERQLKRDSVRPVWLQGPFPSPYKKAINYDNQILVASGIGITPALSIIQAHKDYRRINLVWAVRDPAMLQFFLERAYLDHRGWNLIFYTGKEPLAQSIIENRNCTIIIHERPDIDDVIPNIIYGIESGVGLPERYMPEHKLTAMELLIEHLDQLDSVDEMSPQEKLRNLGNYINDECGYGFRDLVGILDKDDSQSPLPTSDDDSTSSGNVDELAIVDAKALTSASLFNEEETVLFRMRRFHLERRGIQRIGEDEHEFDYESQLYPLYQPWRYCEESWSFVKGLDRTSVLDTWGIMYCGGKNKLLDNLRNVSKQFGIKLHEESFDW